MSRIYGEYRVLEEEADALADYLDARFSIPTESWNSYVWARREGTRSIWVLGKSERPPEGLLVDTWGITAFRTAPPEGYPTNAFMRAFGHLACDGVFQLKTRSALEVFMAGGSTREGSPPAERGYCIVQYDGLAVGRGKWTGSELISDLPKSLRVPRTRREGG